MDFLELAKQRCTTRGFTGRIIDEADLERVLQAGRVAPTACNRQPQRVIVVRHPENIRKIEETHRTFGSPCVLILCQDKRDALIRPVDGKCSGDLDIGIVCDHMMLAARELEIGSVMVGLFDPELVRKGFDIPAYMEPTALLILGYPKGGFSSSERHDHDKERKPLADIVMYERYEEGAR